MTFAEQCARLRRRREGGLQRSAAESAKEAVAAKTRGDQGQDSAGDRREGRFDEDEGRLRTKSSFGRSHEHRRTIKSVE